MVFFAGGGNQSSPLRRQIALSESNSSAKRVGTTKCISYIVQDDRELLARNNIKWPQ